MRLTPHKTPRVAPRNFNLGWGLELLSHSGDRACQWAARMLQGTRATDSLITSVEVSGLSGSHVSTMAFFTHLACPDGGGRAVTMSLSPESR